LNYSGVDYYKDLFRWIKIVKEPKDYTDEERYNDNYVPPSMQDKDQNAGSSAALDKEYDEEEEEDDEEESTLQRKPHEAPTVVPKIEVRKFINFHEVMIILCKAGRFSETSRDIG
jgi:hypothetical protein